MASETWSAVSRVWHWKHSGFSVDQSVRLASGDGQGVRRLIQYFLRCPFSQARMIEVSCLREGFGRPAGAGKVIYKSDHNTLGRFPEPGDEELLAGPKRIFQVFDALDFLAEVTQHIPDPGEHPIRYYGWYSNKSRGRRARGQRAADRLAQQQSPGGREARKRWAALIKQVYEVDPLLCPKCGATMKTCPAVASSEGGLSASSNNISAT